MSSRHQDVVGHNVYHSTNSMYVWIFVEFYLSQCGKILFLRGCKRETKQTLNSSMIGKMRHMIAMTWACIASAFNMHKASFQGWSSGHDKVIGDGELGSLASDSGHDCPICLKAVQLLVPFLPQPLLTFSLTLM